MIRFGKNKEEIQDLKKVKAVVKKQKLDIAVICYGGCCSNQLVDILVENNYRTRSYIWAEFLCHCPYYVDLGIPIIYLYDNPVKVYLSMKRRGNDGTNQKKMANNEKAELSDENLLKLMFRQFKSFTQKSRKDVLIVKSEELFQPAINEKLKNFLKNQDLKFFPIEYIPPKTDIENISPADAELFAKYQEEIDMIKNWQAQLLNSNELAKPDKKPFLIGCFLTLLFCAFLIYFLISKKQL